MAYQDYGQFIAPLAAVKRAGAPRGLFRLYKRVSDIVLATALLPCLVLCAVILFFVNRFWNPGPVLFSQDRVGQNGRIFTILKFRSMQGTAGKPRFAPQELARTTRLGHYIRQTKIDELPQILNVLKGEMSMIGPRPEQVSFYRRYEHLIPGFSQRQSVKPGITGLAQVNHGYAFSTTCAKNVLCWDMEYIHRQGYLLEGYLVAATFILVVQRFFGVARQVSY